MKNAQTISVDPCGMSKGANYFGKAAEMIAPLPDYYATHDSSKSSARNALKIVNFILPTRNVNLSGSLLLLALRLILAALLIYDGIKALPLDPGIWTLAAGAMMAIGFFNRPISLAVGCAAAVMGVISYAISGMIDEISIMTAFLALCVAIAGPGWLSVDGLLRVTIARKIRRNYCSSRN